MVKPNCAITLFAKLTSDHQQSRKDVLHSGRNRGKKIDGIFQSVAKYINQASVNIGGPQVTKVFPYSKVASLLDDEPDKLLIVSGKEPVVVQWRLKNKSNVPWSEN